MSILLQYKGATIMNDNKDTLKTGTEVFGE